MDSDDTTTTLHHQPLLNLTKLQSRMDQLHHFLSQSLTTNTLLDDTQTKLVSQEISNTINQLIVNGITLLSTSPPLTFSKQNMSEKSYVSKDDVGCPKSEALDEEIVGEWDIVELDAVELLAEHLHFCDYCGKGFKRDANLRMHMRAHGNKFKTLEALSKPEKGMADLGGRTRFSCPFNGCSRNKMHKKFRPLKSVICVKNHFKRSHCPKMYSCNRCHKKNFSVLADLKSHLKHCGETKWKCSCGTSFSRKDKLFGHIALFEGHMPAMPAEVVSVVDDDDKAKRVVMAKAPVTVLNVVEDAEDGGNKVVKEMEWADNDMFFNGLLDGIGSIDDDICLEGMLAAGSTGGMDWNL